MDVQECFETLEISAWLPAAELRQIYRDLMTVWHPDRFTHNPRLRQKAEAKIKKINIAFHTLMASGHCHVIHPQPRGEKRRYARNCHKLWVDYSIPGHLYRSSFDLSRDISGSGIFIESSRSPPLGQKIILSFSLPRFGKLMGISGRVAHLSATGFGVELMITPPYQKMIANFSSC